MTAAETRGDRRLHAILVAARALFEERPFDEVTVQMIASRAGITRPNFYHYFDSKQAILVELLRRTLNLHSHAVDFSRCSRHESPRQFVSRRLSAIRAVFDLDRGFLQLCLAQSHVDDEIKRIVNDRISAVTADVVVALNTTQARSGISRGHTAELVKMLAAATGSTLAASEPSDDAMRALERMWLQTLWAQGSVITASPAVLRC